MTDGKKLGIKNLAMQQTLKSIEEKLGEGGAGDVSKVVDALSDGNQKTQVINSDGETIAVATAEKQDTGNNSLAALESVDFATSAKQTDGSQKTQIVNATGDVAGVTNNAQDINIKGVILPDIVTGSIDLASVLHVPNLAGRRLSYGEVTIQMVSTNLSATRAFYLEFSVDGISWDNAVEGGTDVEDTLVVNVPKVFPFEAPVGLYWRIRFASGSTGNVTYNIIG
jgi:hypothetical protein